MTYNNEWFIEKAREVHGDKYDYSKVEYVNNHTKVCIICPEHGEFWQLPNNHLRKHGCPSCSFEKNANDNRKNTKEFIEKAKEIHGDKYDYSKVNYVSNCVKVSIICPEHGEFLMTPRNHITLKQGCKQCAIEKRSKRFMMPRETFIKRANERYNYFYNYDKVNYAGCNQKVIITCPIHGDFEQIPSSHLRSSGCPQCGKNHANESKKLTTSQFIEKAKEIHGDKYSYTKVEYVNYDTPVIITCLKHGDFEQTPDSHLQGKGCSKCAHCVSAKETEIFDLLKECDENAKQRVRNIISPFEIDIFSPLYNFGIEYNGVYWHSDKIKKDKYYHLKKLKLSQEKGIKLIQIFEDEYIEHKDIVLSKIKHIIGCDKDKPKIFGRKCTIKEITNKVAKDFLAAYHIQGFVGSTIYLGAYYEDKLIGVMTFKRELKNDNKWELTRFASDYNYICCGVGGKLFKYFVKNYNPIEIKSFADRRWTVNEENNIYIQLGFKFDSYTSPDYKYIKPSNGAKRFHKFNFRKQILHKKYGLPLSMTESEMTKELGYYKIWDCGLIKYIWKE